MQEDDDFSLFAEEVQGIRPLKKTEVYLGKKQGGVDFSERQKAALIAKAE
ncbi:MAG: DNA endonuclease SmrA, partial [Marinomonas sp.]